MTYKLPTFSDYANAVKMRLDLLPPGLSCEEVCRIVGIPPGDLTFTLGPTPARREDGSRINVTWEITWRVASNEFSLRQRFDNGTYAPGSMVVPADGSPAFDSLAAIVCAGLAATSTISVIGHAQSEMGIGVGATQEEARASAEAAVAEATIADGVVRTGPRESN